MRVRLAYSCALAALVGSACGQGEVEVVLRLPEAEAALPEAADQVTLRAERADGDPVILTAPVRDGAFDLGELPVDAYRRLTVTLTSAGGGLVGYGRAETPLEVSADGRVRYEIPVRRPRTYAAGPTPDAVIEAPQTAETARLLRIDRGGAAVAAVVLALPPGQTPRVVASAGADLFLGVGATVLRLDTSLDAVVAEPVATVGAAVVDLAGSADGRYLVIGAGTELTVVDLTSGSARTVAAGGPVGAVTVASEPDGTLAAVALVNAVKVPSQCAGVRSQAVVTPLDTAEAGARTIEFDTGVADLAGTSARPFIAIAALCANRVLVAELGPDTVTAVTAAPPTPCTTAVPDVVCAPTAVVATDDHAWAAGTVPSKPGTGAAPEIGARHQLASLALAAAPTLEQIVTFPELTQPLAPVGKTNLVFDRNMKARNAVASALSLSEDGAQVTLTSNAMAIAPRVFIPDPFFGNIEMVPWTVMHQSQQFAVSTRTGAIEAQRRTRCTVCTSDTNAGLAFELGSSCAVSVTYLLPDWQCGPAADSAPVADFEGASSSSLFGRP